MGCPSFHAWCGSGCRPSNCVGFSANGTRTSTLAKSYPSSLGAWRLGKNYELICIGGYIHTYFVGSQVQRGMSSDPQHETNLHVCTSAGCPLPLYGFSIEYKMRPDVCALASSAYLSLTQGHELAVAKHPTLNV